MLIEISKENVDKHRAAIAMEAQQKREEAERIANAPPPSDEWTVKLHNIDDTASVFVNGTKVTTCGFSRSCTVHLNRHFKAGTNKVRLAFGNRLGAWTYGYKVRKNKEIVYEGRCGQVWVYGCEWDIRHGVRHTFEFEVEGP